MRRKVNRTNQILELITGEGKIEVAELARRLDVSQVTIRKDLDNLEERGIIRREHGWAVLHNGDDLSARLAYHYQEKELIARRAAELVQDGESVMIENGSCCALLAETLTRTHRDLTILTNSAFIASYIRDRDRFFIGVDGWSERTGFTNRDQLRAQAVRDMAGQAEQVIVLTESEKFGIRGTVPLNLKNQIKMVITDDRLDPGTAQILCDQGIEINTVD